MVTLIILKEEFSSDVFLNKHYINKKPNKKLTLTEVQDF